MPFKLVLSLTFAHLQRWEGRSPVAVLAEFSSTRRRRTGTYWLADQCSPRMDRVQLSPCGLALTRMDVWVFGFSKGNRMAGT